MKASKSAVVFLFLSLVFTSCKKDNTELHGRVVNFITKEPIKANIELFANNLPGTSGSKDLGGTTTNNDGTFSFKSTAGNGTYYLQVEATAGSSGIDDNTIALKKGQSNDVGDILLGHYTFYCRVTLNPATGSYIKFSDPPNLTYNSGTSTQFVTNKPYDYAEYAILNHMYHIGYTTCPGCKDTNVFIPITSTDTLRTTINY